uniref:Uncharacterized protein n=1 Tax=Brassica oleracea TaxID=3712 RepID=A0A3P6DH20_BRAOL|nr:unnamed protein product [Brassica oleracea]
MSRLRRRLIWLHCYWRRNLLALIKLCLLWKTLTLGILRRSCLQTRKCCILVRGSMIWIISFSLTLQHHVNGCQRSIWKCWWIMSVRGMGHC